MNRSLRVLHYVPRLARGLGGPPVVAHEQARALVRLGHSCTLTGGLRDHDDWPSESDLNGDGVEVRPHPYVSQLRTLCSRRGPTRHLGRTANFDIVHLHGVWDPHLRHMQRWAHNRGIATVLTPHGALDPWSLAQKARKKRIALRLGQRRCLQEMTAIQALTAFEQSSLSQVLGTGPRPHVEVIANGVELTALDQALEGTRPPPSRPYALFFGRLHHKKGLDLLAQAWLRVHNSHPDAELWVAGPDEDGSGHAMQASLRQLGLQNSVRFLGPVWGAQKFRILAAARCFILPSRQEGLPLSALEAMAAGVPCILSSECHIDTLVSAGAGLEVELDPRSIARALECYFAEPDSARAAGRAGRSLVEAQFTWPTVAMKLDQLYRRISAG